MCCCLNALGVRNCGLVLCWFCLCVDRSVFWLSLKCCCIVRVSCGGLSVKDMARYGVCAMLFFWWCWLCVCVCLCLCLCLYLCDVCILCLLGNSFLLRGGDWRSGYCVGQITQSGAHGKCLQQFLIFPMKRYNPEPPLKKIYLRAREVTPTNQGDTLQTKQHITLIQCMMAGSNCQNNL